MSSPPIHIQIHPLVGVGDAIMAHNFFPATDKWSTYIDTTQRQSSENQAEEFFFNVKLSRHTTQPRTHRRQINSRDCVWITLLNSSAQGKRHATETGAMGASVGTLQRKKSPGHGCRQAQLISHQDTDVGRPSSSLCNSLSCAMQRLC